MIQLPLQPEYRAGRPRAGVPEPQRAVAAAARGDPSSVRTPGDRPHLVEVAVRQEFLSRPAVPQAYPVVVDGGAGDAGAVGRRRRLLREVVALLRRPGRSAIRQIPDLHLAPGDEPARVV